MKIKLMTVNIGNRSFKIDKLVGQALHIVDIDFVIYESDTWSNPHYR